MLLQLVEVHDDDANQGQGFFKIARRFDFIFYFMIEMLYEVFELCFHHGDGGIVSKML
ncbi:hypothetical protein JOD78_001124 [Herbaspirillum sp. 1130]|nr:hypothetical protein [Herbaspirillum sp. 1130]